MPPYPHLSRSSLTVLVVFINVIKEFSHFVQLEEEVNLYAILNLLNFGSGFRHLLHARKGEDRVRFSSSMLAGFFHRPAHLFVVREPTTLW